MFYHGHQFHPADKELELFFIGCSLKCPGCHNPELQDRNNIKEQSKFAIYEQIVPYLSITKRVSLMGGEPQEQPLEDLMDLCKFIKMSHPQIEIILFTGYDELKAPNLVKYIDFIKFGSFDIDNVVDTNIQNGIKLASSNQFIQSTNK